MKNQSALLATALSLGFIAAACGAATGNLTGTGGSATGGTTGAAGFTGTGGSCTSGTPCGGDVVGTWNVMTSCLKITSSNLDISLAGLDPTSCKNVQLEGYLTVNGSWSANANGTYTDGTTTTGNVRMALPAGCLRLSGTTTTCARIGGPFAGVGFSDITCTDAAGGGCDCSGTINQMGGVGIPTGDPQKNGNYATSGSTLTSDTSAMEGYCVTGNTMTWTPQTTNWTTSGTITFLKSSTSGTGGIGGMTGTGGVGGQTGTGGQTGGQTGTGGLTGTGGTTSTGGRGGTTGSGGATGGRGGTGGTAGSSGTAGRGGTTGSGGTSGSGGGSTGSGGSGNKTEGPCDIYAAAGQTCGAAYSTIRSLRMAYTGPLYQVRNMSSNMNTGSGGMTKDIFQTADGFADTATQDSFCGTTICTFSIIYDQSGNGNDLTRGSAGLSNGGTYAAMTDFESSATKGVLMISGHKTYTLYMAAREGYRTTLNVKAKNVPMGNTAQGIYELADGTHSGTACCWDFGSVSPDPKQYVTMNTLFLGTGFWDKGAGSGPWFMGDFEGGVWAGGSASGTGNTNSSNPSMKVPFALGILHTPVGKYALRMANVQTATDLTTAYDGNIPSGKTWGNAGGIVLGVGGDNSNNSWGTFYEGAVTNGSPSNATDLLIMKNIQAAGYGK